MRQVRWSGIPIFLRMFHSLLWSIQRLLCIQWSLDIFYLMFFWNFLVSFVIQQMLTIWSLVPQPFLVPSCTSGSSRFHVQLRPRLKDFEHNLSSLWHEDHCMVVWTFFGIAFLGIGMKTDLFQSCDHCWVFQICWHNECSTLIASHFKFLNSSAGFPSAPLDLFTVMLTKAHLITLQDVWP